jgi:ElaB/YqjD/DUF883 family membrane-anchored ribosome-binding protein
MTDVAESDTESTAGQAKQKAGQAKDKVQEKAGETAQQVQQKAGETAQQVQQKAQEVRGQAGGRLREEVDTRSTDAGSQLQSTAQAMRSTGEQLRSEGKETPAKVVDAVAQRTERLGSYLTSSDADRILRDVENTARRQPWLVAFAGAALGFLAARFLKASSSRRYESGDGASGWQPPQPSRALSAGTTSAPEVPAYPTSTMAPPYEPGATIGSDPAGAPAGPGGGSRGSAGR